MVNYEIYKMVLNRKIIDYACVRHNGNPITFNSLKCKARKNILMNNIHEIRNNGRLSDCLFLYCDEGETNRLNKQEKRNLIYNYIEKVNKKD